MPLSMKIKPIDAAEADPVMVKPVVKSRLKRLFRISVAEKDEPPSASAPATEMFEPSSVCLAKMVQNFIEENNEKHYTSRNRCNCFNGNGSDGSDGEGDTVSAADVCDFLKSLVVCASMNERNVLADTARVVAEKNKACKRKDELRKLVVEGLMAVGYDAAICKSKWEKSPSFPAGEYEYVDVIVEGERLIIDIDFRSEFEVARSTKTYKSILQTLPNIFVGKSDRLSKIICILSEATKQSLKKKGMHIPPWRKADYVQAKWLSPTTRLAANSVIVSFGVTANPVGPLTGTNGPSPNKPVTPFPSPLTPVSPLIVSSGPSPNNPTTPFPTPLTPIGALAVSNGSSPNKPASPSPTPLTPLGSPNISNGLSPNKPIPSPATIPTEARRVDESEVSSVSFQSETVFEMSECSGEEVQIIIPRKSLKIVTGLASLMEQHKP